MNRVPLRVWAVLVVATKQLLTRLPASKPHPVNMHQHSIQLHHQNVRQAHTLLLDLHHAYHVHLVNIHGPNRRPVSFAMLVNTRLFLVKCVRLVLQAHMLHMAPASARVAPLVQSQMLTNRLVKIVFLVLSRPLQIPSVAPRALLVHTRNSGFPLAPRVFLVNTRLILVMINALAVH